MNDSYEKKPAARGALPSLEGLRTVTVEGVAYVAMADIAHALQEAIRSIVTLGHLQQEQALATRDVVETFNQVLAERFPEMHQELLELAFRRRLLT
jgi:hypothetical protein